MSDDIRSRPATKEYRENWDRVFGASEEERERRELAEVVNATNPFVQLRERIETIAGPANIESRDGGQTWRLAPGMLPDPSQSVADEDPTP